MCVLVCFGLILICNYSYCCFLPQSGKCLQFVTSKRERRKHYRLKNMMHRERRFQKRSCESAGVIEVKKHKLQSKLLHEEARMEKEEMACQIFF